MISRVLLTAVLVLLPAQARADEATPFLDAEGPMSLAEVRKPWLKDLDQVTVEHATPILEMLRRDAEASKLLDEAAEVARTTPIQFLREVRVCDPSGPYGSAAAQTFQGLPETFVRVNRDASDSRRGWPEAREAQKQRTARSHVETLHAVEFLSVEDAGYICVSPGVTRLGAVEALVHEMVHYISHVDPKSREHDVLKYRDSLDFARAEITRPGGEVDAFSAAIGFRARLRKRGVKLITGDVERYFTAEGTLHDREGLIQYLLAHPTYVRKHDREFGGLVLGAYRHAVWRRKTLQGYEPYLSAVCRNATTDAIGTSVLAVAANLPWLDSIAGPDTAQTLEENEERAHSETWRLRNHLHHLRKDIAREQDVANEIRRRFPQFLKGEP